MNIIDQELTSSILRCAYNVHKSLGPGLSEAEYEDCLQNELDKLGLSVGKQMPERPPGSENKPEPENQGDLFVENKIVIGIKSVDELNLIHMTHLMSYLKLAGCCIGLLINFNVKSLKDGIKRIIM
jgi:GxxExxY protein